MFEREWTVRFSDTDPFGIAHYPRIVDAIHETSDMFMEDIGYPYWELIADDAGLPIIEVDVSFANPVRAGDDVSIRLTTDLGQRSVRFNYTAECDGQEAFSGFEQRAYVSKGGSSAIEIPDGLRAALTTASPEAADADSSRGSTERDD